MDLYNEPDGGRVEAGPLARMKRLDPDLVVTFSRWAIDPATSYPLEITPQGALEPEALAVLRRRGNTLYAMDPSFHLWVWDRRELRYHYVRQYPAAAGFGDREIALLEADCARYMTPSAMLRAHHAAKDEREAKEKADYQEGRRDFIQANRGVINDVLGGEPGRTAREYRPDRDAKIYSYEGQGSKGTPGRINKSDSEAGWEKQ